jgi:hypothetical protein
MRQGTGESVAVLIGVILLSGASRHARNLTFDDRVKAQEAGGRRYHRRLPHASSERTSGSILAVRGLSASRLLYLPYPQTRAGVPDD